MHRTHVANVKFAATLWLSAFMFCGLASAQAPSNLFQRIPVSFEENRGQFADDSRFLIHAANARINMKATQLEIYRAPKLPDTKTKSLNNEPQLAAPPVVMSFVNANSKAIAAPSEESSRKSHYIFNDGGQMPKVITAKHFRSVRVTNLYLGIDAVYYDKAGEVEYDLIVQPNADPKQVRLHFGGAATAIDANGNINSTLARKVKQLSTAAPWFIKVKRNPRATWLRAMFVMATVRLESNWASVTPAKR